MQEPQVIYCDVIDSGKDVERPPPPLPKRRESIPALFYEVDSPKRMPLPRTVTVITNSCKRCRQNSPSRKQIVLPIAVAIFSTVLALVFITLYFTTEACQNNLNNITNTSSNVDKKYQLCDFQNSLVQTDPGHRNYSILFYGKTTADYAISGPRRMTAITACFWVKTSQTQGEGSYISYASSLYSNEFLITNQVNLAIKIQEKYGTRKNISINDGRWHSICCLWSSNYGDYKIYKDGMLANEGSGYKSGKKISFGGTWVLGQDQDVVGGRFRKHQAMQGEMSEVNIWDKELSYEEVQEFSSSCQSKLQGNVKSWGNFMTGVKGNARIVKKSTCKD